MGAERVISIHREMTKIYEEVIFGTVEESIVFFTDKNPKGEFVLVIAKKNYAL